MAIKIDIGGGMFDDFEMPSKKVDPPKAWPPPPPPEPDEPPQEPSGEPEPKDK